MYASRLTTCLLVHQSSILDTKDAFVGRKQSCGRGSIVLDVQRAAATDRHGCAWLCDGTDWQPGCRSGTRRGQPTRTCSRLRITAGDASARELRDNFDVPVPVRKPMQERSPREADRQTASWPRGNQIRPRSRSAVPVPTFVAEGLAYRMPSRMAKTRQRREKLKILETGLFVEVEASPAAWSGGCKPHCSGGGRFGETVDYFAPATVPASVSLRVRPRVAAKTNYATSGKLRLLQSRRRRRRRRRRPKIEAQ